MSASVIVVTYNPGCELRLCLESLRSQQIVDEVVVVDNDSMAPALAGIYRLAQEGLISRVIELDQNTGFARGVNIGIRGARSGNDIVLLNPDAVLEPGCLPALKFEQAGSTDIGMLSPLVVGDEGVQTLSAGKLPTIPALWNHYTGLSRIFPRSEWLAGRYLFKSSTKQSRDVDWVAGCCLYIPAATIASVGYLSERWFMYGEDIEYCKRIRDRGLRIRLVTEARAYHKMGVSVEAAGGAVARMWPAHTFDFYQISYAPGAVRRIAWRIIFAVGLGSRGLLIPIVGRFSTDSRVRSRKLLRFAAAVWTTTPTLNIGAADPRQTVKDFEEKYGS